MLERRWNAAISVSRRGEMGEVRSVRQRFMVGGSVAVRVLGGGDALRRPGKRSERVNGEYR